MTKKPEYAFILAAGKGTRLRPYTDTIPKPLVKVGGKSLIDHALDKMQIAGVKNVTVNLHHLAALLENHLKDRTQPCITFSREDKLLDTGGGVKKALHTMGDSSFYLISGDSLWADGPVPALERMAKTWNPDKMDLLLLLQPLDRMNLTGGLGDYDIDKDSKPIRSLDKSGKYMFTSIRICHPRLFDDTPDTPFSFLDLMDKAEANGRLGVLVHDSEWHHISTAADLERVNHSYESAKRYA